MVICKRNEMSDTKKHSRRPYCVSLTQYGTDTDRLPEVCRWHRPQRKKTQTGPRSVSLHSVVPPMGRRSWSITIWMLDLTIKSRPKFHTQPNTEEIFEHTTSHSRPTNSTPAASPHQHAPTLGRKTLYILKIVYMFPPWKNTQAKGLNDLAAKSILCLTVIENACQRHGADRLKMKLTFSDGWKYLLVSAMTESIF